MSIPFFYNIERRLSADVVELRTGFLVLGDYPHLLFPVTRGVYCPCFVYKIKLFFTSSCRYSIGVSLLAV